MMELTPEDVERLRENARTMHAALWAIITHRNKHVQSYAARDMMRIAREALDKVHGTEGDNNAPR